MGALKGHPSQWGKEWPRQNQPILLHFEGCNFGMGGEFHAISICQIGGRFLQMVLEGANKWIGVYGFESH